MIADVALLRDLVEVRPALTGANRRSGLYGVETHDTPRKLRAHVVPGPEQIRNDEGHDVVAAGTALILSPLREISTRDRLSLETGEGYAEVEILKTRVEPNPYGRRQTFKVWWGSSRREP